MLFSPSDTVKHLRFIEEKSDLHEREIAREQLQTMVHFAEAATCRRVSLLRYFGEEPEREVCDHCDNCLSPRETFDGSLEAQKLMSAVVRVFRHGGFYVGLNHLIDVLRGADTEKIRRWGHERLSVYGIGRDRSKSDWASIGRELVRLGYLRQTPDRMSVIELTPEGSTVLKERQAVTLTRPMAVAQSKKERKPGALECDETLFESLRRLRKSLADELGAPPYVVFSDVALRQMARDYPTQPSEFLAISGVGEKKLADYGDAFMGAIETHLSEVGRQSFA